MEAIETELELASDVGLLPNAPMLSQSFVHKRFIGAVTGFAKGGFSGAAVGFVTSGGGGLGSDRGAGLGLTSRSPNSFAPGCPPGTRETSSGRCATTGARGAVERFLPGGRTGFQDRTSSGLLGLLAGGPEPAQEVGTITRNDGTVGPILRCPPGMVLAIDDQCYAKGLKGLAQFRKWKPGTRPFLTGGDVKVLRRANSLRHSKGSKKLLKELGLG